MKKIQKRYLQVFGGLILLLALVRCAFPSVSNKAYSEENELSSSENNDSTDIKEELLNKDDYIVANNKLVSTKFINSEGNLIKNGIYSVRKYSEAFPDSNNVQMLAAKRWGVNPVEDRVEAEQRKMDLVYVGSNPYFYVEKLHRSIPYLVPRAAVLLQDIGRNFFDSLQIKGINLHKPIVTSVTRSKSDVRKLRNYNRNATENSCHLYGTTFDICYNRYKTVSPPEGEPRRQVRNDSLKYVLSEVLNDLRKEGRCYVKYEVKQGCFHITVR